MLKTDLGSVHCAVHSGIKNPLPRHATYTGDSCYSPFPFFSPPFVSTLQLFLLFRGIEIPFDPALQFGRRKGFSSLLSFILLVGGAFPCCWEEKKKEKAGCGRARRFILSCRHLRGGERERGMEKGRALSGEERIARVEASETTVG